MTGNAAAEARNAESNRYAASGVRVWTASAALTTVNETTGRTRRTNSAACTASRLAHSIAHQPRETDGAIIITDNGSRIAERTAASSPSTSHGCSRAQVYTHSGDVPFRRPTTAQA